MLRSLLLSLFFVAFVAAKPQTRTLPAGAAPGNLGSGDFNLLPPGTRLSELTTAQLDKFFANTASVQSLTNCLVNPKGCKSESGRNLVKQITSLKSRGQCTDCAPGEQQRLNEIIYYFVKNFRDRHPDMWDLALPRVIHIVAGLAAN
ncbi:uncharacterized protein LOC108669154 [Hyalella azteca]|uniref:Uncharacterized protein LOC108669154 n=1 Tax=Hyalella azteca TaxID=294128 RepID=A0A979FNL7_HYAAZ|nr:uncharacterized protein LOC108669154 [Hyalella azteca]